MFQVNAGGLAEFISEGRPGVRRASGQGGVGGHVGALALDPDQTEVAPGSAEGDIAFVEHDH